MKPILYEKKMQDDKFHVLTLYNIFPKSESLRITKYKH